jgi:murein DD-endopeptidase MepM/ murein hydrolase activator NlpD
MAFSNPIGKGLSPERIDQGVDYGGSGPLYAIGSGTIANVSNSGWPGGTFLTIHLDTGQYVYYAEDIQSLVKVGQKVTAGEHIANATGGSSGIEIGFAAPPGTGAAMAASQASKTGDPGSVSTAYGQLMSNLIASLGGPAGKLQGKVSGTVPSSYGITAKGATGSVPQTQGSTSAGGGFLADIASILGAGQASSASTSLVGTLDNFLKIGGFLVNPASWVRIGAFFLAVILLAFGIYILAHADSEGPLIKLPPVPIPVPV